MHSTRFLTATQVKNASQTVPRMMMGTTIINGVLSLVSVITYMFVIQDIEKQILESTAAYPWVAVFALATGSNAGAIGMTIPFIVISFGEYQSPLSPTIFANFCRYDDQLNCSCFSSSLVLRS